LRTSGSDPRVWDAAAAAAHRKTSRKAREIMMQSPSAITGRATHPDGRPVLRMLLAGALLAASLLGVLAATGASSAGAAGGRCAGALIESRDLIVNKAKVGELDVYYNRATGKNCAKMNHAGRTWGKRHLTRVWIGICSERRPGNKVCHYDPRTDAVDKGRYSYYAGPVTTKVAARGRCIAASGYLWIGGKRHAVGTNPWVGHCGR
jgi:hypothetical protein